jgi:uncharacterized protein (DUF1697 family)
MLQRQLSESSLSADLEMARQSEHDHFEALAAERMKSGHVIVENQNLKEKIEAMQQRFEEVFQPEKDTQTPSQVLQTRTSEMLMRPQIDSDRARALAKMQAEATAELERTAAQFANLLAEQAIAQEQITQLEKEVIELMRENLDQEAVRLLQAPNGKSELSKVIRLGQ